VKYRSITAELLEQLDNDLLPRSQRLPTSADMGEARHVQYSAPRPGPSRAHETPKRLVDRSSMRSVDEALEIDGLEKRVGH
jgi:hypothetical protein